MGCKYKSKAAKRKASAYKAIHVKGWAKKYKKKKKRKK